MINVSCSIYFISFYIHRRLKPSMLVFLIVRPKCTLDTSHGVRHRERQTDRCQTITICFLLQVVSIKTLVETHHMDTSESKCVDKCYLVAAISNSDCWNDGRLVWTDTHAVAIQGLVLITWRHVDNMQLTAASVAAQWDLHSSTSAQLHTQTNSHSIQRPIWTEPDLADCFSAYHSVLFAHTG